MATIVRGTIPAEEFVLGHTLSTLPHVEIECERLVRSGETSVLPLLWVRYGDRERIASALAADPSVEGVSCLAEFDGEYLFEMDWVGHVDLLLQMLTNGQATLLDAYGRADCWQFRVLYPDREHFSRTHEFACEHGLTFDVDAVREMDGEPAGRFGLTDKQYEGLVLAVERGYFDVPREANLAELADEFGTSHQAFSELLRRGIDALTEDTLLVGSVPETRTETRGETSA